MPEGSEKKVTFSFHIQFVSWLVAHSYFFFSGEKLLRTKENAPSKTLCRLKGRSVSPGKPTNEKPSFGNSTYSA